MRDIAEVEIISEQNSNFIQEIKVNLISSDSKAEKIEKTQLVGNGKAIIRGQTN